MALIIIYSISEVGIIFNTEFLLVGNNVSKTLGLNFCIHIHIILAGEVSTTMEMVEVVWSNHHVVGVEIHCWNRFVCNFTIRSNLTKLPMVAFFTYGIYDGVLKPIVGAICFWDSFQSLLTMANYDVTLSCFMARNDCCNLSNSWSIESPAMFTWKKGIISNTLMTIFLFKHINDNILVESLGQVTCDYDQ